MRLNAIKTVLARGSVKNIVLAGNLEIYPELPYILLYDDYPLNSYYTEDNTIDPFIVEVVFPAGYTDEVTKYVEEEVIQLLSRKVIYDEEEGIYFQVYPTSNITKLSEPNDDRALSKGNDTGTLSKERRFFTPRRGL